MAFEENRKRDPRGGINKILYGNLMIILKVGIPSLNQISIETPLYFINKALNKKYGS
jgi:hypothetical protein